MKLLLLLLFLLIGCTTQDGVLKQAEPGSLKVIEASQKSALLFLNGALRDSVENGEVILENVESGTQIVTLFASKHAIDSVKSEVKASVMSEVQFTLEPTESGDLTIQSDSGAALSVGGLSFGKLDNSGEYSLKGFPVGEHTLSIQSGSKSIDTVFSITENSETVINAQLTLQQQVLVEHISNVSCEYCPHHAEMMCHILDSLGWKNISKISYNANWPATDDPLYLFEPKPQLDRAMLYGAKVQYALPIFVVNGTVIQFDADNEKLAAELAGAIAREQAVTPAFEISLSNDSVTIRSIGEESFSGSVRVNLVQDRVSYEEAPGSNGEKEFLNAFRRLLLDESLTLSAGESKTIPYTIDTSNLPDAGLRLTAFIQDSDSNIKQTADLQL